MNRYIFIWIKTNIIVCLIVARKCLNRLLVFRKRHSHYDFIDDLILFFQFYDNTLFT
jgi:phosphate starvation-inducible membrane PsiE